MRADWICASLLGCVALFVGAANAFSPIDSEFTFQLPAASKECFYQSAVHNSSIEIEYQVIAGAGMDVDFSIVSPQGIHLVSEFRRSDGVHMVEPTEAGDYQICFDNSFSRFSEKMVFFEVILDSPANDAGADDEWAGLGEPESLLEYKLDDIKARSCFKARPGDTSHSVFRVAHSRVRTALLMMKMTKLCHCIIIFLLAYPVEATRCSAAAMFFQNTAEKENINVEKILFTSKLKPSCSHRMHISRIF
uniref:Transmembrane p24 trafficking protein 1b n=1 Tax=Cyprinus carpio TaxID=7962 RepID=A0A8C1ZB80_CYPCA